jgi:hypothetical protein
MVYNTQNYCGFGPFSIVWYSREHDVSGRYSRIPGIDGKRPKTQ